VSAYRRYTASRYAGEAWVYQTRAVAEGLSARPELSWERWLAGGAHIHPVPGEHLDVLQEPHVATLGRLMNEHMAGLPAACMEEHEDPT
jgi:thioesterase domain-containing protein